MAELIRSRWQRLVCVAAALVAPACGPSSCGSHDEVPPCLRPQTVCPGYSCGQSRTIYRSYVAALDTRGQEVHDIFPETFRMVRDSLVGAGGGCRDVSALSLEVRDGGLVGVTGKPQDSAIRCTGEDLVGARFQLEQRSAKQAPRIVMVKIAARGTVTTVDGPREPLPTYDLVAVEPIADNPAGPLCPNGNWIKPTEDPTTHALLIQGETYDRHGTVKARGDHWFNLACAGSALAKMRLHGMNPMKSAEPRPGEPSSGFSSNNQRQATLKMLTANYCKSLQWTIDDTQIFWLAEGTGGTPIDVESVGPEHAGPIESRWGADGALCISHLRLWSEGSKCAKDAEEDWVKIVQRECGIPACPETGESCLAPGQSAAPGTIWRTCTASHVGH